jgi:hypothetical protein
VPLAFREVRRCWLRSAWRWPESCRWRSTGLRGDASELNAKGLSLKPIEGISSMSRREHETCRWIIRDGWALIREMGIGFAA